MKDGPFGFDGGNIVAEIAEGVFRQAPGDAATLIVGSGTGLGILHGGVMEEGLGGTALKAAAGGFWSSGTGAGETITTLAGEASLASTGITAASFADGVGEAKFGYDVLALIGGVAACSIP